MSVDQPKQSKYKTPTLVQGEIIYEVLKELK